MLYVLNRNISGKINPHYDMAHMTRGNAKHTLSINLRLRLAELLIFQLCVITESARFCEADVPLLKSAEGRRTADTRLRNAPQDPKVKGGGLRLTVPPQGAQ